MPMEQVVYQAEYCDLFWTEEENNTLRENWKIANCSLGEFKSINNFLLDFCRLKKIKNLIIDAFGAISLMPEEHHTWLEQEFNSRFGKETQVENIFVIIPESLVTSISINKFHDSIKKNKRNIKVIKMKSSKESYQWIDINSNN